VAFHAHPDDEALLTAGTIARLADEGHRVVIVCATDGAAGLARAADRDGPGGLAERRRRELEASAAVLGAEVRFLGYDDSGLDGTAGRPGLAFARADESEQADRLASILAEVGAHALMVYDEAGGYGHPDHIRVHRVGVEAARRAGVGLVLEATVDRRAVQRVLRLLERTPLLRLAGVDRTEWNPGRFARAFADPGLITHRVDVRRYCRAKKAAMAAHRSQAGADSGVRTLAAFVRLPMPVFRLVFGREWYVERGRPVPSRPLDDVLESLGAG
jgi:LmbE family N-acetylglucosaminyl deacetylase